MEAKDAALARVNCTLCSIGKHTLRKQCYRVLNQNNDRCASSIPFGHPPWQRAGMGYIAWWVKVQLLQCLPPLTTSGQGLLHVHV